MDWVVFDLGGVIVHPPTEEASALLVGAVGADPALFWEVYWAGRDAYDRGTVDAAGYWGDLCGRLGRVAGHDLLDELVRLDLDMWMRLNEGTMAILGELAARGVSLALLSNAPLEMARLVDGQPWASVFEHRLFSADLRYAKPDPEIYRHLCDRLGAEPSKVVFVDDRTDNVAAARAAGIEALVFADVEGLRADLDRVLPATAGRARRRAAGKNIVST